MGVATYIKDEKDAIKEVILQSGIKVKPVYTPEDLELVRRIYASLPEDENLPWMDVLALLEHEPELAEINQQIHPKDYREFDTRNKK